MSQASWFMKPTISTSPLAWSCTTAGINPSSFEKSISSLYNEKPRQLPAGSALASGATLGTSVLYARSPAGRLRWPWWWWTCTCARTRTIEVGSLSKCMDEAQPPPRSGAFGDHDLCRLDDRQRLLPSPQLQLVDRVAGDDRRQPLVANPQPHLREQPVRPDLFDDAAQLVAAADRHEHPDRTRTARAARGRRFSLRCQHPVDLGVGDPVMSAARADGPHRALVDPLLQRGIADAEPVGRGANGQERHYRETLNR